jgi:hypothetical protein
MTDPKTDIERETTGEQYVEGNMEIGEGVAPGGTSMEDLDVASDDTPDSLSDNAGDANDAADNLSVLANDETPDSAP